jgi:hypothetical protein
MRNLAAVLVAGALCLSAQQLSPNQTGLIPVTVTDPMNRFVTGLEQENFTLLENGISRPITSFSSVDSPISLAIIAASPFPAAAKLNEAGDELIQTESLPDAIRLLTASKNPRKALILTTASDGAVVPAGIRVVHADSSDVLRVVIELRNQYLVKFQPSTPAGRVEVVLSQPRGLPVLKPHWDAAF